MVPYNESRMCHTGMSHACMPCPVSSEDAGLMMATLRRKLLGILSSLPGAELAEC